MDRDLRSIAQARELALRAKEAADAWAHASQAEVDRAVEAVALAGRRAARELAELSVRVTGYGRPDHKEIKNRFNTTEVYEAIAPLTTVGILSSCPEIGVVEVAEPVGVIAALIPTTNPVSTVFFKSLIAVKARNAIVLAPHPRAADASAAAAEVVIRALRSVGAPDGLVSCMTEIDLAGTNELMHHHRVSLVLATGSLAMVRAAYSSGKPTYAVGPGNVPSYVHASVADLEDAVGGILASATFDHGTPCASEQALIVDRAIEGRVRQRLESLGARFLTEAEAERLVPVCVTPQGTIHPECVGQPAAVLAERAGIRVDPATTVLVVSPRGVGRDHPLSMEILTSMLKWYPVSGPEEGIARAGELLRYGGDGHTAAIWATDERVIASYAAAARAFRVLVNTPSAFGAMGATAGLPPSFMLGTGTWGGSITADNIGPLHLINRKRVARGIRSWREVLGTAAGPAGAPGMGDGRSALVASTREDPRAVVEDLVRRVLERLGEPVGGRG
jgi:acetaldehyde dehydrogenase (acetylating)